VHVIEPMPLPKHSMVQLLLAWQWEIPNTHDSCEIIRRMGIFHCHPLPGLVSDHGFSLHWSRKRTWHSWSFMIHQYSSSIKSIKRDCGVRTRLISESHRLQSSSQKHGSPASSSTSHDRVVFGSSSSSTGTAW
jgi:ribosomal protein L36